MSEDIRMAIEAADAGALASLVAQDPSLATAVVTWGPGGKNRVPPLHFVCDAVFRGLATQAQALAMAEVLLEAGVDPNLGYTASGDTFLIAAASLGAEDVGLRLLERGADVAGRGLFGATALHWAAIQGLDRLAPALVDAGSDLELADTHYGSTPLQWALHAWIEGTNGRREGLAPVVRAFVARGAQVTAADRARLEGEEHEELRAALGPDTPA